jgi:hypothetical protein
MIETFDPTHVVLLAPVHGLLRWALTAGVRILCLFADSFETGRLRHRRQRRSLAAALNDPAVEWVGNHNTPACRSLVRLVSPPARWCRGLGLPSSTC